MAVNKNDIPMLPEAVVHPPDWLRPKYLISPFNSEYVHANNKIVSKHKGDVDINRLLEQQLNDNKKYSNLTKSGREAITILLRHLKLAGNDEVLILNTSGSSYISSCVTKAIGEICKWSRELTSSTKCVLVIHEFGFPAIIPKEIADSGLTIVEDCAYCFGSQNEMNTVGKMGDYAIYSFSKIFPVQFGGLIRSNVQVNERSEMPDNEVSYLSVLLQCYIKKLPAYLRKKKKNYLLYKQFFFNYGIKPRYKMNKGNVPSCFVFKLAYTPLSDKLKVEMNEMGIESTVYYGGDGYYVPCHQNLNAEDIQYICRNIISILGLNRVEEDRK